MDPKPHERIKIICVDKGRGLAQQVMNIFGEDKISLAYERSLDEVVDRFERERFDLMLFSSTIANTDTNNAIEILDLISVKLSGYPDAVFHPTGQAQNRPQSAANRRFSLLKRCRLAMKSLNCLSKPPSRQSPRSV